jgi:hypothetical protein
MTSNGMKTARRTAQNRTRADSPAPFVEAVGVT